MIRVLSFGGGEAGVFAVGMEATGFIAVGQLATGFIAVGQEATGVIAIGQLARGVVAVGQLALGIVAVGMVAGGVLWCTAMLGVAGTSGHGLLVYQLLGRPRMGQWPRRLLAVARREPWDTPPRPPVWRRALGIALLAVLIVAWWYLAGQPALAAA